MLVSDIGVMKECHASIASWLSNVLHSGWTVARMLINKLCGGITKTSDKNWSGRLTKKTYTQAWKMTQKHPASLAQNAREEGS